MNRLREPYEAAGQRHEDALRDARETLTAAVRHIRTWEKQRPRLERRLGAQLERLWKKQLGLRPRPRFRRRLPAMPHQRYDRRLRRLRRKKIQAYGKKIHRLRGVTTRSWASRWLRQKISLLRLWRTLRSRPGWTVVLFLTAALILLRLLAPAVFEDLLAYMTVEMLGP